jgi:uncharacterized protein YktA (UPF0223 family)
MNKENIKYHYFYKITNNLNGHYYYGVHNTKDLEDGYMGSGKRLQYAIRKYGVENFTREILKYFDSKEEAYQYESEIVTESLVEDPNCYNLVEGGRGSFSKECNENKARLVDEEGKCRAVSMNDPIYKSGLWHGITKGKANYRNKITGEIKMISVDQVDKNVWEFISVGKTVVKDSKGNIFLVDASDEKIKAGIYTYLWKGRKHKESSIQKMHETHLKNEHQKGSKNSQYGTCWVFKNKSNKKISLKELDDYIQNGWIRGRLLKDTEYTLKVRIKFDYDDIINMLKNKESIINIAKKYNCNKSAVFKFLKKNHIDRHKL